MQPEKKENNTPHQTTTKEKRRKEKELRRRRDLLVEETMEMRDISKIVQRRKTKIKIRERCVGGCGMKKRTRE